jgi:3-hydroxybutyryl-CoA dehydratase
VRFDDLVIGQSAEFAKTITETDIVLYAGLTGDMNPLHIDEVAATSSRFGKRVAHGMLTAGLISAVLGMKLPGPGAIYLSQWLQFTRPVHIGDTVTAKVAVAELFAEKRRAKLATTCTNQDGKTVIEGEAMVLLP